MFDKRKDKDGFTRNEKETLALKKLFAYLARIGGKAAAYLIKRAHRSSRGWVSREEVAEIAAQMGPGKHAKLAEKLYNRRLKNLPGD